MTYEGLRLKLLEIYRKAPAKLRRKKLKNQNFTIISNNCWGGMIYEQYGISKQTPTVGLFFMAQDFITFISDLHGYINAELKFISPEKSKWKNNPEIQNDRRFGSYPIGILNNGNNEIEIFFLHYHNEKDALEKWQRRCQRIHWDSMLYKFNDQNGCTENNIEQFVNLPLTNKLFFTSKKWEQEDIWKEKIRKYDGEFCYIRQFPKYDHIMASYEPFGKNRYFDTLNYFNNI